MKVQTKEKQEISAPGTLVLSGYATVPDITKCVTPCLKETSTQSSLIYIDFTQFRSFNLGGTIIASVMENQLGSKVNDIDPNSTLYIKTILFLLMVTTLVLFN